MKGRFLIATSNDNKKREVEKFISKVIDRENIYTLNQLKYAAPPEEDGETFLSNSIIKSEYYSKKFPDFITMADDSGLEVDTLDGRPGVLSSRYSGKDGDDESNIDKLLSEMDGTTDRRARFITFITLSMNGSRIKSFKGIVNGLIALKRAGEMGFGYDPVFFYPPLGKTFGEIPLKVKNSISHRADALKKMQEFLKENPGYFDLRH